MSLASRLEEGLTGLRVVAQRRGCSLADEVARFALQTEQEIAALRDGIAQHSAATGTLAHQLAGRFGFVRAVEAAHLALDIEVHCRANQWSNARALTDQLRDAWTNYWTSLRSRLAEPSA